MRAKARPRPDDAQAVIGRQYRHWSPGDDESHSFPLTPAELLLGMWPAELHDPRKACATYDKAVFYPTDGAGVLRAQAICDRCPSHIVDACLQFALEHDEREGVWGGTSERERRRIRRSMLRY